MTNHLKELIEDVMNGKYGTKNRAELLSRLNLILEQNKECEHKWVNDGVNVTCKVCDVSLALSPKDDPNPQEAPKGCELAGTPGHGYYKPEAPKEREEKCKRCGLGPLTQNGKKIQFFNDEGLCFPCELELRKAKNPTKPFCGDCDHYHTKDEKCGTCEVCKLPITKHEINYTVGKAPEFICPLPNKHIEGLRLLLNPDRFHEPGEEEKVDTLYKIALEHERVIEQLVEANNRLNK